MPVLTISKKALEAGRPWEPGWTLVIFNKLSEPEASSSGKSNNYKGNFTNVETGAETDIFYNDSEFLVGNLAELFAAAADIPVSDLADRELDFDKIKGSKLWVRVENELYKKNPTDPGRLTNKFTAYAPESQRPF